MSPSARGITALPPPQAPAVVLYDQYDNLSGNATFCGTLTDFTGFDADDADDFVVPAGQTWTIDSIDADGIYFNGSGPANSWNVFVYMDGGGIPGGVVASEMNLPATVSGTTFTVNFSPPVAITAGHYWVEIQANLTFGTEGQWGWTDRTVQSNSSAAWQNPGGGFGTSCTSWMGKLTCIPTAGGPDNVYRLNGTTGNGTPTPTPTATPTPTVTPTPTPTPTPPGVLWYNGDFDGVNGLANENNTLQAGPVSSIYDDFIVTDAGGWDVNAVFSDNLSSTNITGATWEIRTGLSEGFGGAIVASGTTAAPMVTATGRSGFGFIEYQVKVPGLSVFLPMLPAGQTYWLNVTPIGDLTGRSFDSTTSGANAVGMPPGNDQNAFWNSAFFGFNFTNTGTQGYPYDFSMGVNGDPHETGGITLNAKLRRQSGNVLVAMSYTGTDDSGSINVLRDGVVIHTKADNGRAQDRIGPPVRQSHTYQVCEPDTGNCSNVVTVQIP